MSSALALPGLLEGPNLRLRPLKPEDRQNLFAAAADPLIWAQHPAKNRYEQPVFDAYFDFLLTMGESLTVEDRALGKVIGTSRIYVADDPPASHSIGYTFLARSHWGGRANFEMKTLMIDHILSCADAVWFHIDAHNLRSQKATEKLGARLAFRDKVLDFGNGPAHYQGYRLDRAVWETVRNEAARHL